MVDAVYEKLAGALNARSTAFPAVKCDEFYDLVSFLFTPEEASIFVAMPLGLRYPGRDSRKPARQRPEKTRRPA